MTATMYKGAGNNGMTLVPERLDNPKQVGVAVDVNGHDILKRVYSEDGKSPTLNACTGGNREPKVVCGAWRGRYYKDGVRQDHKGSVAGKTKQMLEKWLPIRPVKDHPFQLSEDVIDQDHFFFKRLKKISKEALDKYVTPHMLRHSLGIFLRQRVTKDIELIRRTMRHEKITTTQIYVEALDSEVADIQKSAQKKMEEHGLE